MSVKYQKCIHMKMGGIRFKVFRDSEIIVHDNRKTTLKAPSTDMLSHERGLSVPLILARSSHPKSNCVRGRE